MSHVDRNVSHFLGRSEVHDVLGRNIEVALCRDKSPLT
jgi:hypothetical protein